MSIKEIFSEYQSEFEELSQHDEVV
jgi:hypothetical protein